MTTMLTMEQPTARTHDATRTSHASEQTFTSWDGTKLFYRAWLPANHARRAVILLHRGHEHSGRFHDLVERLSTPDTAFFAWDARGHGRSPGDRGYADSFATLVKDLDAFARHIATTHDIRTEDTAILAHSVAAVIAAAWVHDYAPPIRAMVLATPALRVKLYIPFALPALRLRMLFGGKAFVTSYVKSRMLTHDPEQQRLYDTDPLISKQIAVNILLDLHDASTRLLADAGAITTPTLLLAVGSDWVVKNSAQRKFFERLSSPVKQMRTLEGFHHAIFHESRRDGPIADIRAFLDSAFDTPRVTSHLIESDQRGHTKREYDSLSRRAHPFSPRGLWFGSQRIFLKTLGRLSTGIRIGWRHGFDSGQSLDYVYRNRASGITPVGKLIDWFYLNAIGWRGVRQRKLNLETLVTHAIARVRDEGRQVHLLDIASGPGRYMLDILKSDGGKDLKALLRDHNEDGLAQSRATAHELGLTNVIYATGDAFDPESLSTIRPRPQVAVVSGLYELFPDNALIQRSLQGLSSAIEPNGYLIYTNQPWHPQIEMIARVLDNRDGKPWIMRRRTQAEMDELVRRAGFEKIAMEIDRHGIFTVSLARKVSE